MLRLSRKRLTLKPAKSSRRRSSSESSSRPWSDLTPLVLDRIRDLLDSDLYDLRLRSVCSNWRKSLSHPRRTPSLNFPIDLPDIPYTDDEIDFYRSPYIPNCSRIYRISPADDPSHGWLIRSLDTKPNTFTLLDPLNTIRVKCPPDAVRNSLDLLQFRVSEICKCYRIDGVDWADVRQVLFLPNFVENVAFTVMVVVNGDHLFYYNDGDSDWTEIEPNKLDLFHYLILFNGICYVVRGDGCLLSLNSYFQLTEVIPPIYRNYEVYQNRLVAFESDLFLVSETRLKIFKRVLNRWDEVTDLGDIFLLSSSDVSVGFSAMDFKDCKGNFVYLSDDVSNKSYEPDWVLYNDMNLGRWSRNNIYDLDQAKTVNPDERLHRINMCWPPPEWMMRSTS